MLPYALWGDRTTHSSMTGYMPIGTYDQTSSGNAYGNHNCDMDNATMEGRDESGRTTSGPDTIARRKTRGCRSDTMTTRSVIPEQTPI